MLELYLVRHGETLGNVWNVFYGKEDYPLTELGREQAREAAEVLQDIDPAAIYASPSLRTMETAAMIAKHHPSIQIVSLKDLEEMHFGLWEGLTQYEIAERFPASWHAWCDDWWSYQIPQGESASEVYNRTVACIDKLMEHHEKGEIIVVGHHGSLRAMISHLLGFGREGYWRFRLEPGRITRIEVTDGFAVLGLLNG